MELLLKWYESIWHFLKDISDTSPLMILTCQDSLHPVVVIVEMENDPAWGTLKAIKTLL